MDQYTIPKIRAVLLLASDEAEVSFDTASPAMDRLIEYTKQDPCAMFAQAQFVLDVPYSEDCLSDVIVYIDFSAYSTELRRAACSNCRSEQRPCSGQRE